MAPRTRFALALILLLGVCLWGLPVLADAPIEVVSTETSYSFGESITFELQVRSSSPLSEVILFYGRVKGPLARRIYPDFTPVSDATIRYEEELERGQYAPGTVFLVWWELHNEAGDVLVTEPENLEYAENTQDWQVLPGERVDVYWYGQREQAARDLMAAAEEALTRLETDIGVAVDRRVRVYVYNNERDMRVATAPRSSAYDDVTVTLGMAVDDDTMLLLGSDSGAEVTLAHELSHIVVGIATENPYAGLPRWLDEGLAMYAQGMLEARNERALQRGIQNDELLSVRSMSSYSGRAEQVDLWYGAAYSVVDFMLEEFGRTKMQQLLGVFSEGAEQEAALQQVLNIGLDDLDAMWRTSLGLGPRASSAADVGQQAPATVAPAEVRTPEPTDVGERRGLCGGLFGLLLAPLGGLALVSSWRPRVS